MPIAIRHEDEDDWWHRVASRGEHAPHPPEETAERMVDTIAVLPGLNGLRASTTKAESESY